MGKYAHVSARFHLEPRREIGGAGPVELRHGLESSSHNANGNGSPSKPKAAALSIDTFIEKLQSRKYFEPGGAARDNWSVFYGKTIDEAWDKADDKANSVSLQVEDYQVICVKDAIRAARWTSEMDKARRRVREAVEKGMKGIPGLPPHAKHRAISDAEMLANLMVLKNSGESVADSHYNLMIDIKEIWDSGFGRYAIVEGKHLVYAVRQEEKAEKLIRTENPS